MSLQQIRDRIVDNYNPETRLTMLTPELLDNIEHCIRDVVENKVRGDFIECGVWKGGACIYAYYVLKELGEKRKVYVADSFQGLPAPNVELYPQDNGDIHHTYPELAVSLEKVKQNFQIFGDIDDSVVFVEGFFRDTLPNCDIEKISVLRLDGDMYESTWESLIYLYHKLEVGGYCIIDDYSGVRGCTLAVDKFRKDYEIDDEMMLCQPKPCECGFHPASVFWKKTKQINI
jgi:O-methyltransferase